MTEIVRIAKRSSKLNGVALIVEFKFDTGELLTLLFIHGCYFLGGDELCRCANVMRNEKRIGVVQLGMKQESTCMRNSLEVNKLI